MSAISETDTLLNAPLDPATSLNSVNIGFKYLSYTFTLLEIKLVFSLCIILFILTFLTIPCPNLTELSANNCSTA